MTAATGPARPELVSLDLADPPERWIALGFDVSDGHMLLGGVDVRLGARGHGITAWSITNVAGTDIDGLPTTVAPNKVLQPAAQTHPNGALAIDHVVVVTPDFERTAKALTDAGMPLRRIREEGRFRQGFRRLGPAILELVDAGDSGRAPDAPAHFWGLVVIVGELEQLAHRLGEHLGTIKPAVQAGRRIATLRGSAGIGAKIAFMDPEP